MSSYVNQDLSGQSFVSASLTGANFTGANATNTNFTGANCTSANFTGTNCTNANFTNVNLTNAIITNTTFNNTNITGATLTGITFSNLQKGQLLLRLENLSNTAVNNLTSLTIQELRIVQPTISLRSLNTIQGVTVIVPNNTGQGYFVAVTPNINQVICIFAATNQNIILTSSGNIVKTVRNTGTVIQDIDNANATISYIKIGSVSYRFSIGNSDGVIAMIPIDTNLVRVNDAGINDIISLNTTSASPMSIGYSWDYILNNNSTRIAKVNFSNLNINMLTNRVRGVMNIKFGPNDFGYPCIFFNNNHTFPSSASLTHELSRTINIVHNSTWSNQNIYNVSANVVNQMIIYQDGSMTIAQVAFPQVSSFMTIKFDIDLQKNKDNIFRQLICTGEWTWTSKLVNSAANYVYNGYFTRISEIRPVSSFLVASYNFDSNPNDTSTNGNTLTNVSSVIYSTTDFIRGTAAAQFNGSNYFEVSNDGRFSPENFTVAVWVKPKTLSTSYQSIASCRASSPWRGWMLYIGPDNGGSNLEIWSSSDGSNFTGQTSVYANLGRLNRWVHVAFTLNQSTSALLVYIDGTLVTTTTLGYTRNLATNLRIGAGSNETGGQIQVVNGTLIDDFNIFNRVLTPSEIANVYSSTFASNPNTSLVAHFNFDSNVNDSSPNFLNVTNTLTNYNSVIYNTTDFKRGTASAQFSGANYFQITNNDFRFTPNEFTITMWVKPTLTGTAAVQSLATCREAISPYSSLKGWMIYIGSTNKLEVITGGGSNTWNGQASSAAVPDFVNGVWRHLAITISRTTGFLNVYTDGVFRETTSRSYVPISNSTYPLRIGAGGDLTGISQGEFIVKNGTLIDDFRLYNRILTAPEIANIFSGITPVSYNNNITLNDIGLCGYSNSNPGIEHITMNLAVDALPSFS